MIHTERTTGMLHVSEGYVLFQTTLYHQDYGWELDLEGAFPYGVMDSHGTHVDKNPREILDTLDYDYLLDIQWNY